VQLGSLVETMRQPSATLPRDREEVRQLITFSFFGVGLGILGALSAWLLYHLINLFTGFAFYGSLILKTPLYPPPGGIGFMTVVVPVVGGLIVGVMAKYGTDRIRGHGIPEAMEAVLKNKSNVSVRVAIFKPISAAIAVGTGGPFGAEGPIIQTGGALGSLIGQAMRLSARERRILLACGGAAGMVGIFNTPIAAVALALELLLFEFRARSLVPVILASATAAGCRVVLMGSAPMFNLGFLPAIGGPLDLLWFVPLGIIVGCASVLISRLFYIVEEFFDHLRVDMVFKPALGALVLGLVALAQPRVLGMGYVFITDVLKNDFGNGTLLSLGIGKSIALIASLGSGTSGGLLAPMLLIGATIGSGFGRGVLALWPKAGINPSVCGIVAMSSLFSAAARAPLTSFIFAFELTGDYKALLPLMIGCMVADVVARSLAEESIMTERLVRRGLRIDQGYEARLLNLVSVGEVMTRTLDTLAERTPLRVALQALLGEPVAHSLFTVYHLRMSPNGAHGTNGQHPLPDGAAADGKVTILAGEDHGHANSPPLDEADGDVCSIGLHHHRTFPVLDADGALVGVVTRQELLNAAADASRLGHPIGEIITRQVVVAYTDEALDAALTRLLTGDFHLLPVVDRDDPRKLRGVLTRRDILEAWRLRSEDETRRERLLRLRLPVRRHGRVVTRSTEGAKVTITTTPATASEPETSALSQRNMETLTPGAPPAVEEQQEPDASPSVAPSGGSSPGTPSDDADNQP
jgi:CIC family chloride channel protein